MRAPQPRKRRAVAGRVGRRLWLAALAVLVGCRAAMSPLNPASNVFVEVTGSGNGSGVVVSRTPEVPMTCSLPLPTQFPCKTDFYDLGGGGEIQLRATSNAGSFFQGWTGDCADAGTSEDCVLSFSEAEALAEVHFEVGAAFTLGSGPGPGTLQGTIFDVDGSTAVDALFVSVGYSGATGANDVSDAQGAYEVSVNAGRYAVFSAGVRGFRYLSTPGDTTDVLQGEITTLDLHVTRGYGLHMVSGDLGMVHALQGDVVSLALDFQLWNRDLCPGCVPSVAIGVDGHALSVFRLGAPAGVYPGTTKTDATVQFTAPSDGGSLYAFLVATSTAADIQPGLDLYEEVWSRGPVEGYFIPIGTLVID